MTHSTESVNALYFVNLLALIWLENSFFFVSELDCLGELRELRKKMNWETMRNRLNIINADDMNDPALSDPVLKAKLRENSEKGRKR